MRKTNKWKSESCIIVILGNNFDKKKLIAQLNFKKKNIFPKNQNLLQIFIFYLKN